MGSTANEQPAAELPSTELLRIEETATYLSVRRYLDGRLANKQDKTTNEPQTPRPVGYAVSPVVADGYTLRDVSKLQRRHPLFLPWRKDGWKKTDSGWVPRVPDPEPETLTRVLRRRTVKYSLRK
ncbi:hypothetical protein V5O48_015715 [Marasmius crinis-equi]|uniref:Uncharacterized protein n=1 Tax=Marasmius crinis-equi TaxID=585013 RepID=A0ABR3EU51_9AGAR